jgi:hypothetical protein
MSADDRLARLETHLETKLSGFHRALRSINETTTGSAMKDEIKIPEGYTRWDGEKIPVAQDAQVHLILRDGWKSYRAVTAGDWFWGRANHPYDAADIIAYKIEDRAP